MIAPAINLNSVVPLEEYSPRDLLSQIEFSSIVFFKN